MTHSTLLEKFECGAKPLFRLGNLATELPSHQVAPQQSAIPSRCGLVIELGDILISIHLCIMTISIGILR